MEALRIELREEMGELRTELRADMGELRKEVGELRSELREGNRGLRGELTLLRGDIATQNAELLATFRQELNEALLRSNRSMIIGLSSTLLAAITLATILARFVT